MQKSIVRVPEATLQQPQLRSGDIIFMDYSDRGGLFRNSVLFDTYAFSFVQNGEKQIFRAAGNTILKSGNGMLIPEGNSIIAEHSDTAAPYQSVIVFFPGHLGKAFIASRSARAPVGSTLTPYVHFKTNSYINEYVRHIQALVAAGQQLSEELAVLKVQELLTATYEIAPSLLTSVFGINRNLNLKQLIETNLQHGLTLAELAFLANRSLSSFKRDFEKIYGVSPQRYIRDRRLELAGKDLALGRSAGEIYLDYGYQHLSNFNTAFKRKFGVLPSGYQP